MITSTPICSLFFPGRPAAIAGFVVPVIVDAVNGVFRGWRVTHVAVKGIKGIEPFRPHRDPSIPIVNLGQLIRTTALRAFRIAHSVLHVLPSAPDLSSPLAMFMAAFFHDFSMQAAAALRSPIDQRLLPRNGFVSAIAAATPTDSAIRGIRRSLNHGQSSESLTRQIFHWRHWPLIA